MSITAEDGWSGSDVDFLRELNFIRLLIVVDLQLDDVAGIGSLTKLRELRMFTYARRALDMSRLRSLVNAAMTWNPKFTGVGGCTSLRRLHVGRLTHGAMAELSTLGKLRDLDMIHTMAKDFSPVWKLQGLQKLRIGLAPHLTDTDFRGVARLKRLEELRLKSCRQIESLVPLAGLKRLRELVIQDCGPIASIRPLDGLSRLEELHVNGNTKVLDGDFSMVLKMKKLRSFASASWKHCVPSVREIDAALVARHPGLMPHFLTAKERAGG